jgi:hypothetical protein
MLTATAAPTIPTPLRTSDGGPRAVALQWHSAPAARVSEQLPVVQRRVGWGCRLRVTVRLDVP